MKSKVSVATLSSGQANVIALGDGHCSRPCEGKKHEEKKKNMLVFY